LQRLRHRGTSTKNPKRRDTARLVHIIENAAAAIEHLEHARATRWGDSVEHVAQKLRDDGAERVAYDVEVEHLRADGLLVLSAQEADEADGALLLEP